MLWRENSRNLVLKLYINTKPSQNWYQKICRWRVYFLTTKAYIMYSLCFLTYLCHDSSEKLILQKFIIKNHFFLFAGIEMLKLFVIGNTMLIFVTVAWPSIKQSLYIIRDFFIEE